MRHDGHPYPFKATPWAAIRTDIESFGSLRAVLEIVQSVLESEASTQLAGTTWMRDLIVVPSPVPEPPFGFVRVGESRRGVVIEHVSGMGRDDRVERPAAEAVSLFWRFMIEKYGIASHRGG